MDADMNKDSGGRPVYLCIARKPSAMPITAITVVFGISGEFFPPGACSRAADPRCPCFHCTSA